LWGVYPLVSTATVGNLWAAMPGCVAYFEQGLVKN
jgi:hypothetical protein